MKKNYISLLSAIILSSVSMLSSAQEWNLQTIANGTDTRQLMRIDNNGNPHVMVGDKFYVWDGLAWQNKTVPAMYNSDYTFCLNDVGIEHFLCRSSATAHYLNHKYMENNVWVTDQIGTAEGYYPVAIFYGPNASQSKPDILSFVNSNTSPVTYRTIYIHKYGSSYGSTSLITINNGAPLLSYPSADYCTDADGNLYYVYTGIYDEIVFNFYDGTTWSSFNITDGTNHCQHPRITLDQNDIPHVSYYDEVTKDLIHAKLPAQTLAALKAGTLKSRVPSQTIAE